MKLKSLIKTFSFTELQDEMPKQDWRLPTLEEARSFVGGPIHDEFWIEPFEQPPSEYDAPYYSISRDQVGYINKSHRIPTVVVKLPRVCSRCEHYWPLRGNGDCARYDFNIPAPPEEFGCTTEFKRKDEK